MTKDEVRNFVDVTIRQADEAFRKQMEESDRRIDAHVRTARHRTANPEARMAALLTVISYAGVRQFGK